MGGTLELSQLVPSRAIRRARLGVVMTWEKVPGAAESVDHAPGFEAITDSLRVYLR